MKYIIYLFSGLCSLANFAQENSYNYTQYHPNGNVKTFLDHNSGSYVELYDNSQRKIMGQYQGGVVVANLDKKLGEWVHFNERGDLLKIYNYQCQNIKSKAIYDDSCRAKSIVWQEYFPNTKSPRNSGVIKDYKKEGKWEKFYENGKLREVINYKKDLRSGESFYYYDNGNLAYKTNYVNDEENGKYSVYDASTKKLIADATMLRGKFDGSYIENYANGNIKEKGFYIQGDKSKDWEYYFENGKIKMQGPYLNNKRTGVWKRFDEIGNLLADISFKDGEKHGNSIIYNKDGSILKTEVYKNGNIQD